MTTDLMNSPATTLPAAPTSAASSIPASPSPHRDAIAWFEIPVLDMDRAQVFYEAMLGQPLRREPMGPQTLAVLPYDAANGVGGALLHGPAMPQTSSQGTLIYLNAGPVLEATVARALAAGARISTPRVDLPDGMGSFVHVIDSEGNRIGLHALA